MALGDERTDVLSGAMEWSTASLALETAEKKESSEISGELPECPDPSPTPSVTLRVLRNVPSPRQRNRDSNKNPSVDCFVYRGDPELLAEIGRASCRGRV